MKYTVTKDGLDVLTLEGNVTIKESVPVPEPPPEPDRSITIDPPSGPKGTFVTITAKNWGANEHFEVWVTGALYTRYQTDPSGNLEITLEIPMAWDNRDLPFYDIKVMLAGGAYSSTKTFTISEPPPPEPPPPPVAEPYIELSPDTGPQGSPVQIYARNIPQNKRLNLNLDGMRVATGLAPDANGSILTKWILPTPGVTTFHPEWVNINYFTNDYSIFMTKDFHFTDLP